MKIVGNLPSETLAPALGFSLLAKEEEENPMLNQWEADRPFVLTSFCCIPTIFFVQCVNNIVMKPI